MGNVFAAFGKGIWINPMYISCRRAVSNADEGGRRVEVSLWGTYHAWLAARDERHAVGLGFGKAG